MAESYELGRQGEELAADYLVKHGCQIVERRWKWHHLEVDILAYDPESNELVSVEVKTRASGNWGTPEDAVDLRKIHRIVNATDFYMKLNNIMIPVRFDIFSVIISKNGEPHVEHIKDAFYPPLSSR